ncbi:MAG: 1,4-alpha-glucan branching protein GlgB [Clostridiales bacterium]|nr:1,4-alpha-glucan branching protein GlgB [Clostridiales bacterium]
MKNKADKTINKTANSPNDLAAFYFHQGTSTHAYDYLGCHTDKTKSEYIYTFRVWAPNANRVDLTGDFNGWSDEYEMTKVTEMGVWEYTLTSPDSLDGCNYKYRVYSNSGVHLKADPYAFASETLKGTASKIYEPKPFKWSDSLWLARRMVMVTGKGVKAKRREFYSSPMNIYEVHLGSWKTKDGRSNVNGDAYLNYREIADELAPYAKQMGYTHVELMPIMEHPFDGSWGYQVCGYYSPTARYGTPEDFKYFVNKLHTMGIGVILDWVPAHFPKDEHGLYEFDGVPLYEYQGRDRMEHEVWGTRFFDVARNEVESFLISNALYWLREFHADGLRVDAVASMLYLDYDRRLGEWIPNRNGGNENLEAIAFFQKLNTTLFAEFPDALMIAEESTAWPMVTKPVADGGLGFNFKWNMGWANDTFEYVETDPLFRKHKHEKLTFPMMYSLNENYILPVSHDEVVHGKKSLLDKMFGDYDNKFAGDRLFMAYQICHPGKKLTFMGCEYGQFREWDYENQLEWFMLDYDMHKKLQKYTAELNRFYLENRPLWELDFTWDGFEWIYPDERDMNIIAFRRMDKKGSELVVVLNFAPVERKNYEIKGLSHVHYVEVFNSDRAEFGGSGLLNEGELDTVAVIDSNDTKENANKNKSRSLTIDLPGLSAVVLKPLGRVRSRK